MLLYDWGLIQYPSAVRLIAPPPNRIEVIQYNQRKSLAQCFGSEILSQIPMSAAFSVNISQKSIYEKYNQTNKNLMRNRVGLINMFPRLRPNPYELCFFTRYQSNKATRSHKRDSAHQESRVICSVHQDAPHHEYQLVSRTLSESLPVQIKHRANYH